jgi:hypothetical protein
VVSAVVFIRAYQVIRSEPNVDEVYAAEILLDYDVCKASGTQVRAKHILIETEAYYRRLLQRLLDRPARLLRGLGIQKVFPVCEALECNGRL